MRERGKRQREGLLKINGTISDSIILEESPVAAADQAGGVFQVAIGEVDDLVSHEAFSGLHRTSDEQHGEGICQ